MENQVQQDRWLSVLEISNYIGISKETVYRWIESKRIPCYKIGKQWKFKVSEVDGWIKSGKAEECSN